LNKTTLPQTIKVTIVGGYLGSGKTTLINHLITQQDMSDCVFLVNDFGTFNIDAELIASQGVNTIELKNGCVCCSMANGLTIELLKIIRNSPRPKRIIIETSGVADPAKIRDLVVISKSLQLDQVIVLADADRIRDTVTDRLVGDTVKQQLRSADTVVLNKIDSVSKKDLPELEQWLQQQAPQTEIICTKFARLPTGSIFRNHSLRGKGITTAGRAQSEPDFQAWSFQSNSPFDRTQLEQTLNTLPPSVQRVKGFVRLADDPEQAYLLQWVPGAWSLSKRDESVAQNHSIELNLIGSSECSKALIEEQFKMALL